MSDIPNDLFRHILCHVSTVSLYRFRSVCKGWRSIIDDHQFVKMHQQCHPTGNDYIFIRNSNTRKLYRLPLSSLDDDSQIFTQNINRGIKTTSSNRIVGRVPRVRELPVASCHGLVMIPAEKPPMDWLLWNPFNGELLKLPVCDDFVDMNVALTCSGIGYDAVNDDYKVVRFVPGEKIVTFIYSMNSNTWHRIEVENFQDSFIWFNGAGVFRNGSLHWAAGVEDTANDKVVNCIIALNLTTETFSKVPMPTEVAADEKCTIQLDALGGHFFLSCSYRWSRPGQFDLWMNADSGSENTWIRIWSSRDIFFNVFKENNIRPVAYLKNKELVLLQMYNREFRWCDVKNKCLKAVEVLGFPEDFSSQVFPASLVRFKGNDSTYQERTASEGTLK